MNISVFIIGHKHLTTIKMAKAKKEGKKKKSRKSVLKTLRLIDHNNKILKELKMKLEKN
jgi:hypothetical protein